MKLEYQKLISDQGVPYNFLTIDGENTYRNYFGKYSWLPDESGFICGKIDGSFYYYNVKTRELNYLDKTGTLDERQTFVRTYVNPTNGLVYYEKKNDEGFRELWSIDPKTQEKVHIYTTDREKMCIGHEVTNDGHYTYYVMGYPIMKDNEKIEFGRIDLQKGVVDRSYFYGFPTSNCINHFGLNPAYPELFLFHHESVGGILPKDRLNIMDFLTGKVTTYKQPGSIAAHAMWARDGEHITFTDYLPDGTAFSIADKDFENRQTWLVEWECGGGNHCMADADRKYALCDDYNGVVFVDLKTGEKHTVTFKLPDVHGRHCYHAHSEITASGKIGSWGLVGDDGVLGIAWFETSYFTNK